MEQCSLAAPPGSARSSRAPVSGGRFWPVALAGLAFYAAAVTVGGIRNADQIDGDTVGYLRLAGYLAQGRLFDSISGTWSPLFSWCIAALMALGIDGLHAARIVLVAGGAGLVVATGLLARRFETITRPWQLLVMALASLVAAHHAIAIGMPDVLTGVMLVLYFWRVTDPRLLEGWRRPLVCGLIGGVACLAKAYALPFFLVHFSATVILRYYTARGEPSTAAAAPAPASRPERRTLARALAMGVLGAFILAGPWITLMSIKYGRPTFGTTAAVNHAISGPKDIDRSNRNEVELMPPPPGRLTWWEVPEALPWPKWSPFESRAYFLYEVSHTVHNVSEVVSYLRVYDFLGLSVALFGAAPILALTLRRRDEERFRLLWFPATVALYSSGLLLFQMSPRLFLPVLMPVCFVCVVHVGRLAVAWLSSTGPGGHGRRRAAEVVLAIVLVGSFGAAGLKVVVRDTAWPAARPHREVAAQLRAAGWTGPAAGTRYDETLYICYHLGTPCLGGYGGGDPRRAEADLDQAGARLMLVWPESPLWGRFGEGTAWVRVLSLTEAEVGDIGPLDAYALRE